MSKSLPASLRKKAKTLGITLTKKVDKKKGKGKYRIYKTRSELERDISRKMRLGSKKRSKSYKKFGPEEYLFNPYNGPDTKNFPSVQDITHRKRYARNQQQYNAWLKNSSRYDVAGVDDGTYTKAKLRQMLIRAGVKPGKYWSWKRMYMEYKRTMGF